MSEGVMFGLLAVIILVMAAVISMTRQKLTPSEWIGRMVPKERKSIAVGIVVCLLIIGVVGLLGGCSGASMYAGLDQTFKQSPQCVAGGSDDRITSNIGFKGWYDVATDVKLYTKYTHHSCAFSPDRNSYDAAGAGVEYRFW